MLKLINPQSWATRLTHLPSFKAYLEPFVQKWQPYWRAEGYLSQVLEVREELADVFTLVIRPGKGWPGFQAGQHVEVNLYLNGVRYSRYFSISSSPHYFQQTGLLELTIREQPKGKITPLLRGHYAQAAQGGEGRISLSRARGEFVLPLAAKPILMLAGGSGITPFRSMLQQLKRLGSTQSVQLLYLARDAQQHVFQQELQELARQLPNAQLILLNDKQHGFINAELLAHYCPDAAQRQILICGPAPMIVAAQEALTQQGVAASDIQFERFNAAPLTAPKTQADSLQVSFVRSAKVVELVGEASKSLLEIAEEHGLKPLSGCRAGVCHQCVCQKTSGRVFNTLTGEYSDNGKGEVQLCVSVPVSDLALEV